MSETLRLGMTEMMKRVAAQTEQKALWKDRDDPEAVVQMIAEETEELRQAVQESMLSGDVFNVASEIGDVLYLALKFCSLVGLVPEDVVQLKILRNDLKYPNDLNSHGEYSEQRRKSKEFWEAMGGDGAFSHAYLETFANLDEEPEIPEETPESQIANIFNNHNGNGNGHHTEVDVFSLPELVTVPQNGNGHR